MPAPKTSNRNEKAEQALRAIRGLARGLVYDASMAGITDRYQWAAKVIFDLSTDALKEEGAYVG